MAAKAAAADVSAAWAARGVSANATMARVAARAAGEGRRGRWHGGCRCGLERELTQLVARDWRREHSGETARESVGAGSGRESGDGDGADTSVGNSGGGSGGAIGAMAGWVRSRVDREMGRKGGRR